MKRKSVINGLLAMILTSCSEEYVIKDVFPVTPEEVLITAEIDKKDNDSRVIFNENGSMTHAYWEMEDTITLFTDEQSNLHYRAVENDSDADTPIKFVSTTGEVLRNLEGQMVYACYPKSNGIEKEINLPSTNVLDYNGQNIVDEITGDSFTDIRNEYCSFLYGKGIIQEERLDLNFNHLFAYLKLVIDESALPCNDIDKLIDAISLSVNGDEPLSIISGTFDLINQTPTYANATNEVKIYRSHDLATGKLILYVPVLPQSNEGYGGPKMYFSLFSKTDEGDEMPLYSMRPSLPYWGLKAGYIYEVNIPMMKYDLYSNDCIEGVVSEITSSSATITATIPMELYDYTFDGIENYKISVFEASSFIDAPASEVVVDGTTFKRELTGLTPGTVYVADIRLRYEDLVYMGMEQEVITSVTFRTLE